MTTFTEGGKVCERGTGLFARDCDCDGCTDLREEFIALHVDLAKTYLANRPDYEKVPHLASIKNHIERYKEFL